MRFVDFRQKMADEKATNRSSNTKLEIRLGLISLSSARLTVPLLMVVGFTAEDGHGAVELLNEQQPDHLMAERHLTEADLGIRTLINRLAEPVRTADNERQTTR